MTLEVEQRAICAKWNAPYLATPEGTKLGVALNLRKGLQPINGLRIAPGGEANGWYIWAGEVFSEADDFFQSLHAIHLSDWCPSAGKFLGLAPGWRFLIADCHEDVWFDPQLLSAT
ncbi:MAG: hypothetical protein JF615_13170 [Asticcacaulis sp.]|nr:hypothetical protein [Asticcacaulis sp.]